MVTLWAPFGENWATFTPKSGHTGQEQCCRCFELAAVVVVATKANLISTENWVQKRKGSGQEVAKRGHVQTETKKGLKQKQGQVTV